MASYPGAVHLGLLTELSNAPCDTVTQGPPRNRRAVSAEAPYKAAVGGERVLAAPKSGADRSLASALRLVAVAIELEYSA